MAVTIEKPGQGSSTPANASIFLLEFENSKRNTSNSVSNKPAWLKIYAIYLGENVKKDFATLS